MAMANNKSSKALVVAVNEERDNNRMEDNRGGMEGTLRESIETSVTVINSSSNAPKYGTIIPNRVFVGGISSATTEFDLAQLFSNYGTVTGTKIISDRAGISKGYGFVTFQTEDEARRLQRDAENIVLRERRLNIAPAVKKQGFGGARSGYEGQMSPGSPVPLATTGVYKQNGIPYTFHNGMAFFPQPASAPTPQLTPVPASQHVESPQVYQTGGSYSSLPQGGSTPFPFSYTNQSQMYYQPQPYQYHVPYDGCYEVLPEGVVMPQYYTLATPQPAPEMAYYPAQPAPISLHQEGLQPVIYASPRTYDSSAIIYSEPPKPSFENGMSGRMTAPLTQKEDDNNRKATSTTSGSTTPVVSLLKLNNKDNKGKEEQYHHVQSCRGRGGGNGKTYLQHQYQTVQIGVPPPPYPRYGGGARRGGRHPMAPGAGTALEKGEGGELYRKDGGGGTRGRLPSPPLPHSSHPHPHHSHPNPHHPIPQVPPQFPPFYPRQPVFTPTTSLASFYPTQPSSRPPPPLTRPYFHRSTRYNGGRGRGVKWNSGKDITGDELGSNQLTPPITPRSPRGGSEAVSTTNPTTPPQSTTDHLTSPMQALAI